MMRNRGDPRIEKAVRIYSYYRQKETELLDKLSNCNYTDNELIKQLVPVQQRRAKAARIIKV